MPNTTDTGRLVQSNVTDLGEVALLPVTGTGHAFGQPAAPVSTAFMGLTVEAAFGVAPLTTPTSSDWVSLTGYIRGLSTRRGRQHLLARTQAGEAVIRLANRDGRFDPTNVASPYYPNVLPMTRIRVRTTVSGTTYDIFQGFAEDWSQDYGGTPLNAGGDTETVLRAVDGFKLLGLFDLVPYSDRVAADAPLFWWKLDEQTGTTAADSGSGNLDATYRNLNHQMTLAQPDKWGATRSVSGFGGASLDDSSRIEVGTDARLNLGGDVTVEFWALLSGGKWIVSSNAVSPFLQPLDVTYSAGQVNFTHKGTTVFATVATPGNWHHYACVSSGPLMSLYQDGAVIATAACPGGSVVNPVSSLKVAIGDASGGSPGSPNLYALQGSLQHIAIYARALSAAQVAYHAGAPFDAIPAAPTGTHIATVLDAVGWPGGERSLSTTGITAQQSFPSGNALEWLLRLGEDTETGLLQISAAGAVAFASHDDLIMGNAGTSQATFGDGGGEIAYSDFTVLYNDDDLYTTVIVPRDGAGVQTATDATAVGAYGPRQLQRPSSLAASDIDTIDEAAYLLQMFKAPALRADSVVFRAGFNAATATLAQMFGRTTLYDRITVKRRPVGGNTITRVSNIEGVAHDVDLDAGIWTTTFSVVPADTQTYWLLGDATYGVLDSTTRLYF